MTRVAGASAAGRVFLLVLAIGGAIWPGSGPSAVVAGQEESPAPIEVGAGPIRERSLGLVGRTIYGESSAQTYGYLTDVIGLDPALLFTDAQPSVQTARFTYAGEIALADSGRRGDVTAFAGEGTLRIYLNQNGGAVWDDPASFAGGEPVAEFSLRLRDTMQRQSPGVGVVVGDERFRQEMAGAFILDGASYRFGHNGIEGRLRTVGVSIGGGSGAQTAGLAVGLTGSGSVLDRESVSVSPGGPEA